MNRKWVYFLFLLCLPSVQAQATVTRNEAVVDFPNEVVFHLELTSPVETAVLTYDVGRFSCLEASTQIAVTPEGDGTTIAWSWIMSRSGNPPPGTQLWWEWTVTDTAGNTFTVPRQFHTITDPRFEWQTITTEDIQLHSYNAPQIGETLMEAAVAGLERLENEMGINLQTDVQLFIYDSSDDMREAILYVQDWAGAVAFPEYNTILMGVPPNLADSWGRSTVSHELAHLVIGQFGRSCVGGARPVWLEEGLAVYAEGEPAADIMADIETGIADNSFRPLRSLNGPFPAHGREAGIAYSQSYSVVDFMLTTYGREAMQALILLLADGVNYDEALESVYGLNVDELEAAWREALGIPERPFPPTPTPFVAANIATVVPFGGPQNIPTPPAAAQPPPSNRQAPLCNLGLLPILFFIGWSTIRRQRVTKKL